MSTPYSPLGIVPGLGSPTTPAAAPPGSDQRAGEFSSQLAQTQPPSAAGGSTPLGNLVAPAPSDIPKTLGAGYDALTPEQAARFRSSYDNLFQA